MKKTKIKVTIYSRDEKDFITEKVHYCHSQFLANQIMDNYATKDDTIDIEMEVLQ